MRAKLVVFPIRGRNWCFSRSIDHSLPAASSTASSHSPSTIRELWKTINMNKGWFGLERAPDGSFKKKIYGLGLWLLSRVKPSEIFLKSISKSISKEVTGVEVIYPSRLNKIQQKRSDMHK